MSNSSEPTTRTVRVVYRETPRAGDLRSYHEQIAEQRPQLPRRETAFEQAERERAEQQGAS